MTCDLKQFFPSIDHAILRDILARKIDDADVMWLIDRVLESGIGVLTEEYTMVYFPGDDPSSFDYRSGGSGQGLFAANRPRGLPIGNLTSQFWANCYLNPFDHFVKRELRCGGYVRYVDDFLLFADDKRRLAEWRGALIERLAQLRVTLHAESAPARPVTEGISFLGFIVFPTHRRLKRRKGIAFQRRLKGLLRDYAAGAIPLENLTASVRGWTNHVRYGDTWGLRRSLLAGTPIPPVPI